MEAINVYREAIKRTFADVYQVLPETIDVSWGDDTITVRCSDHNFTHKIDRDDETTLEFISDGEDPVTIALTDDERRQQGPSSRRLDDHRNVRARAEASDIT
jgi:hypothetical protein